MSYQDDRGDRSERNDQDNRNDPDHRGDRGDPEDGDGRDGRDDRIRRVSHDRADRGARWNRGDQPYVDAQAFTGLDTYVYEAIATLEFSGRPVTRDEITKATDLDDPAVGEVLDAFTEHGVLVRKQTDTGEAFELARRDWSATPDRPSR